LQTGGAFQYDARAAGKVHLSQSAFEFHVRPRPQIAHRPRAVGPLAILCVDGPGYRWLALGPVVQARAARREPPAGADGEQEAGGGRECRLTKSPRTKDEPGMATFFGHSGFAIRHSRIIRT